MSNEKLTLERAIEIAIEMGGGEVWEVKNGEPQYLYTVAPNGDTGRGVSGFFGRDLMQIHEVRPLPPRLLTFDEALPRLLKGGIVKAQYGTAHTSYALRLVRTSEDGKTIFGSVDMRLAKQLRFHAPEDAK